MSSVINATAMQEAQASSGIKGFGTEQLPPAGYTRQFYGALVALFTADLLAGAVAAGATVVDATLAATAKDAFLRSVLGYTANDPPVFVRPYAYRVSVGSRDAANSVPPSDRAFEVFAENIEWASGPTSGLKLDSPGLRTGTLYANRASDAATTVAATTINVTNGSRISAWKPIPFGDVIAVQTDIMELRALQAFTAEDSRIFLEIAGEWVKSNGADWARQPCVPSIEQHAAMLNRFRQLFPAVYAECYGRA